ncbi:methyl-accepting chemotaxis protein [Pseudomonas gingeri]|nr:methyl-accepting chemotaxis protein [Pseudomonas gingeri]NWD06869.1 methyl-accepting chemotaxis protein [Pseudomonas gingeri]NWE31467.1 methyl-accepting chemotaxis protein [Pseudomonas gingeri]NWE57515.1 methyl-accepting chemotaxis protein [Pseudomonas gingeri]NWE99933.1 methyl-accepting chemotaxis protein [Pseudomonas gingeri]
MGTWSIKTRITLAAGSCLFVMVLCLVGFSLYQMRETSAVVSDSSARSLSAASMQYLEAAAQVQSAGIEQRFLGSLMFTRSLATQVVMMRRQARQNAAPPGQLRSDLYRLIRAQVATTPEILGVGLAFEPNALDGADSSSLNGADYSGNASGRFALYVSSMQNFVLEEKDMQDNDEAATAWWNCPKRTRKPCLVEPYTFLLNNVPTLTSSIALPLMDGGKSIGVVSIDLPLSSLQNIAQKASASLFEGQGQLTFVSAAGSIMGRSGDPGALGKSIRDIYPGQAAAWFEGAKAGKTLAIDDPDHVNVILVLPFAPMPNASPWMTVVEVPRATLMASVAVLQQVLERSNRTAVLMQVLTGLAVTVAGTLLMLGLAVSVTRPIRRVSRMLENIANGEGDLTQRLSAERRDEVGVLAGWFNCFLDKLQPVIVQVSQNVSATRSSADQASLMATQASSGMQQQLREVEQVATAAHEMSATSQDVARNASRAATAARAGDAAAGCCRETIEEAARSIQSLASHMSGAMRGVHQLADSSEKIGSVLDVIRTIAQQTNLLALNAAIEAARAGETGRGFAVVADEVRYLAQRTQDSVGEIQGVIESLQSGTREVVSAMQSQHRQADASATQALEAVGALAHVSQSIEIITDMNLQIASAAEEQSAVTEEVNRNVSAIRDVTGGLVEQAHRSARISQSLNDLANQQQRLMSTFKV